MRYRAFSRFNTSYDSKFDALASCYMNQIVENFDEVSFSNSIILKMLIFMNLIFMKVSCNYKLFTLAYQDTNLYLSLETMY